MISSTEATAHQLSDAAAQLLRLRVSSILHTDKPPKSNLSHGLQAAVRKLQDKDIIIVPADEGNATVIMDHPDYTKKMEDLMKDGAHEKLKKDLTNRIETKVSNALKKLEERGYIDNKQQPALTPCHSAPPQIHGLPKVHKERIPLRSIVAAIDSRTHLLAKKFVEHPCTSGRKHNLPHACATQQTLWNASRRPLRKATTW